MKDYNHVDEKLVKELRKIVGSRGVIYNDPEQLSPYAKDEAGGEYYAHMPEAVVKPTTKEEILSIIRLANKYGIPITPRGAGSGLSGGAVPLYGGIVISLERMNNIIEIDKENMVALVEPGVVTNDLCKVVAEEGLYYAGYPMSVETSFIGGNVATNAGGSKVIKYGNTGHHVLGIETVIGYGDIVEFGGKRRKDSSGYNFINLMVGSEGTLGIFTKIYLNLVPLPGKTVDLLIPFKEIDDAISNVALTIKESSVLPTAVEFIDKVSVELGSKYNNTTLPFQDEAKAYLIVQFEGRTKRELEEIYEKAGEANLKNGALDVFIADNRTFSEKIWRIRRNWLEGLKAFDPYVPTGDIVVPTSKIPEIMSFIEEISKKYNVTIPVAGHAADGNLHPAPIKPKEIMPEEWMELSEKLLEEIALKAAELGGAISGEHGIGFIKKKLLPITKKKEFELMKIIKKEFDPNRIMNPGKLF